MHTDWSYASGAGESDWIASHRTCGGHKLAHRFVTIDETLTFALDMTPLGAFAATLNNG